MRVFTNKGASQYILLECKHCDLRIDLGENAPFPILGEVLKFSEKQYSIDFNLEILPLNICPEAMTGQVHRDAGV